jgi:hypothetical protein
MHYSKTCKDEWESPVEASHSDISSFTTKDIEKRNIYFSAEGNHCSRKRLTLQARRHDLHYMSWSLGSPESVMGGIFRSKDEIYFSWV